MTITQKIPKAKTFTIEWKQKKIVESDDVCHNRPATLLGAANYVKEKSEKLLLKLSKVSIWTHIWK